MVCAAACGRGSGGGQGTMWGGLVGLNDSWVTGTGPTRPPWA